MNTDPYGTAAWWDILAKGLAIVGTVALGVAVVVSGANPGVVLAFKVSLNGVVNGFVNESQGGTFTGGYLGGVVGDVTKTLLPIKNNLVGASVGGAVSTFITKGFDSLVGQKDRSFGKILLNSFISGGINAATSVFTSFTEWLGDSYMEDMEYKDNVFGEFFKAFFSAVTGALSGFFGGK